MQKKIIMILGGYGVFGQKIALRLCKERDLEIVIAGRNLKDAEDFSANIQARAVSLELPHDLEKNLMAIKPDIVINCCGPFQANDYAIPEICIRNKVHYIDIADGRDYVTGFQNLDALAKDNGVIAVTGVSTVPAISSAVIDAFQDTDFSEITEIDYGISPGNQTPRGVATVASILSYVGKPIQTLIDNRMQVVYGWQHLHRQHYPFVGNRWMSNCDIPDLDLFKERYKSLRTIRFYAGLELPILHLSVWVMSWLSRWGIVNNFGKYAAVLRKMSLWFYPLGSEDGGMHMKLMGKDKDGKPHHKTWYIIARQGHGPNIPAIPAVILAKMIARDKVRESGASACIGFITLQDIVHELSDLAITTSVV